MAGCLAWPAQTVGITVCLCVRFGFLPGLIFYLFPSEGRRSFSSTSARKADITLTVDGKEVTVPQGATLVVQHVQTPIYDPLRRFRIDPGVRSRWRSHSTVHTSPTVPLHRILIT